MLCEQRSQLKLTQRNYTRICEQLRRDNLWTINQRLRKLHSYCNKTQYKYIFTSSPAKCIRLNAFNGSHDDAFCRQTSLSFTVRAMLEKQQIRLLGCFNFQCSESTFSLRTRSHESCSAYVRANAKPPWTRTHTCRRELRAWHTFHGVTEKRERERKEKFTTKTCENGQQH